MIVCNSGLYNGNTVGCVYSDDMIHSFGRKGDSVFLGDGGAGRSGTASADRQRCLVLVAELKDVADVILVSWQQNRTRQGLSSAIVDTIGPAIGLIGQDGVGTELCPKIIDKRRIDDVYSGPRSSRSTRSHRQCMTRR